MIIDSLLADLIISYSCISEYASLAAACKSFHDVIVDKHIDFDHTKFRYVNDCIVVFDQANKSIAKLFRKSYKDLFRVRPEIIKRLDAQTGMYISLDIEKLMYGPKYKHVLDFSLQNCLDPIQSDGNDYAIRTDSGKIFKINGLVCINKNGLTVLSTKYIVDNGKDLTVTMLQNSVKIPVAPMGRIIATDGKLPLRAIMELYANLQKLHILPDGTALMTVLDGPLIRIIHTDLPNNFAEELAKAIPRSFGRARY